MIGNLRQEDICDGSLSGAGQICVPTVDNEFKETLLQRQRQCGQIEKKYMWKSTPNGKNNRILKPEIKHPYNIFVAT